LVIAVIIAFPSSNDMNVLFIDRTIIVRVLIVNVLSVRVETLCN
jgi:hypothetical protein